MTELITLLEEIVDILTELHPTRAAKLQMILEVLKEEHE
jgi:hypothetical protein